MTEEILTIKEGYVNDDSVESYQYIEKDTDQGTGSLNNQTELTITFQNQDAWLFPSDSYLRIEGVLKTADGVDIANNAAIAFVNNGLMYLFSNVKYFLGTLQIEYFENAGVTTSMHNYLTKSRIYMGDNWFWSPDRETAVANASNIAWRTRNLLVNPQAAGGVWNFSATLPLSAVFSFCNDYRKVIYGMQHKISLTRTNNTRALLRTNAAVAASGIYPALDAIANNAVVTSKNEGTHWVCWYKNGKDKIYFDSFGVQPPLELIKYLSSPILYSTYQIQQYNDSNCGEWCLHVLNELNRGRDFFDIILNIVNDKQ